MNRGKRKFEVPKEATGVRKKSRGSGASLDSSMEGEGEKYKAEEVVRLKEIFPNMSTKSLKVNTLMTWERLLKPTNSRVHNIIQNLPLKS